MLELNGTVEVANPTEALRHEDGIFKVTAPQGQVFQVTCRKGSMRIREIGGSKKSDLSVPKLWQIEKLARPVA